MDGAQVHYFGFGSLVNRQTRPREERAIEAHLPGWQRIWHHRVGAERAGRIGCTSLSIEPRDAPSVPPSPDPLVDEPPAGIHGVVVSMAASELPGLDARESGYERLALPASSFRLDEAAAHEIGLAPDAPVFLYRSHHVNRAFADGAHPILQSYVDCVMAGYLERFGIDGLDEFVRSTRGWHGMRRDDRTAPGYPRAIRLAQELRERIDACLARWLDRCDDQLFVDRAG